MNRNDVIDGASLYHMFRMAFTSLSYNESYLNDINTFPVSDSDTGTNMKQSFHKGLVATDEKQNAGDLLFKFAYSMSLDSRGNSGFILSQYFIGLSEYLKGKESISIEDFKNAIVHAYKIAYAAVVNPAEGTMLTVMREGAKNSLEIFKNIENQTFDKFFEIFSKCVFESTLKTNSQMSLLKTNNVVDSGALGFYLVVDGMKKSFKEDDPYFNCEESGVLPKRNANSDTPLTFFRYCTEFTINLKGNYNYEYYSDLLKGRGDSLVLAINGNLLKVHIHTNGPNNVINIFKKFGSIVTTKVDDLFLTQEFNQLKRRKHSDYAVVCFTYGKQIASLFEKIGADACFTIPHGHEPSEDELKSLIEPYYKENTIFFSADKKIEDKLKSIAWWGHYNNFVVVECRGIVNTFFKIGSSMFDGTFNDFKKNLEIVNKVKTIEFKIDKNVSLRFQLERYLSPNRIKGHSTVVAFGGKEIDEYDVDTITSFFTENDGVEFTYFPGGQEKPHIIIGVM